jgi:hypothetical protein
MPVISMFYGIIILMYFKDNKQHHLPHIHVKYQGDEAVFSISDGDLIEGSLPTNKIQLVKAWIIIHNEELLADWELAVNGQSVFAIDPLK